MDNTTEKKLQNHIEQNDSEFTELKVLISELSRKQDSMNVLLNSIDKKFSYVKVKNGGGSETLIKREDFEQRTYDKPDENKVRYLIKETLDEYPAKKINKWGEVAKNLLAIISVISLLIALLTIKGGV